LRLFGTESLLLAERPSLQGEHVSVVHEAVADRIGDGGVGELVPTFRVDLGRDDSGGAVVTILEHLEEVTAFGVFEGGR
jgi:hypothetical protein